MSSIPPIQAVEPVMRAANAPQAQGGEAFAELLDGADAPAGNDAAGRSGTEAPPAAAAQQFEAGIETASAAESMVAAAALTEAPAAGPEPDAAASPAATALGADALGEVAEESAGSTTPAPAEGMAEAEAGRTADRPAEVQAAPAAAAAMIAPEPALPDAPQAAATMPAAETRPAAAPSAAAPALAQPAEGETPAATAAQPARAAGPMPEQPAQQPAPQANAMPAAAGDNASTAFEGEADRGLPQRPQDAQGLQAKPQEAKAAPQAEAAKPAAQPLDPAAPRIQPAVLPEPVRALATSFNAASVTSISLHPAAMNQRAPVPLQGAALAVEIVGRMQDGLRRFDIRLDPPELGRVDVRLEVDRSGNVTTKLTLDRPETLELMQREARGLERALQQAGLKTDEGGLEFSLRSHADHAAAERRGEGTGRAPDALAGEDGAHAETAVETYRAAALARGGVDIRI